MKPGFRMRTALSPVLFAVNARLRFGMISRLFCTRAECANTRRMKLYRERKEQIDNAVTCMDAD